MKTRARLCWWCNQKLSAVGHAVVNGRQVHKVCEPAVRREFRYLTAQPKSAEQMDAQIEDQTGTD